VKKLIIVDTKQPDRIGPWPNFSRTRTSRSISTTTIPLTKVISGAVTKKRIWSSNGNDPGEVLREKKLRPTPMEATILTLGIYEETGCLLFPSTTERDLLAVAYLIRKGANLTIVSEYVKIDLRREELELLSELLAPPGADNQRHTDHSCQSLPRFVYRDAAILAHKIMDIEDIDAVIIILSMEGKTILVARSRVRNLMYHLSSGNSAEGAIIMLPQQP